METLSETDGRVIRCLLEEAHRVLKPAGHLLIVESCLPPAGAKNIEATNSPASDNQSWRSFMDEYFYPLRFQHDETEWRAIARRAILHMSWQYYGRTATVTVPRILDIGCGTGMTMVSFTSVGSVWGIDVSPLAVMFCKHRGLQNVFQGIAEELPFRNDSFDLITMADVLEHMPDDVGVLRELYRVCAPRGLLTVVVPAFQFLWSNRDERLQHKRRYTVSELRAKTEQAGFKIHKCTYIDTFLFPPLFILVKLGLLSGSRPVIRMDVAPRLPLVDRFWLAAACLERILLRWLDFPLGVSVLCVAQKMSDS